MLPVKLRHDLLRLQQVCRRRGGDRARQDLSPEMLQVRYDAGIVVGMDSKMSLPFAMTRKVIN